MGELIRESPSVIYDVRSEKSIKDDFGVIISRKAAAEAYRALEAIAAQSDQIARRCSDDGILRAVENEFYRAVNPETYEE